MKPLVKICGMNYNVEEVARLSPDYLGFIFYEKSPRNYSAPAIRLPEEIQKVGVFVNAPIEEIIKKVQQYTLQVIQLHGDETPSWIQKLKKRLRENGTPEIRIWKVFSVDDSFDFKRIPPFETSVDAFLFDTKGKQRGGTGEKFNWGILKEYPSNKPVILSGGIGPETLSALKEFIEKEHPPIMAIDLNSKFETEPGRKNIAALKTFMHEL